MRYQTVARCVERGCHCDHRNGVVLYDGDSRVDAEEAAERSPYTTGYEVTVEPVEQAERLRY